MSRQPKRSSYQPQPPQKYAVVPQLSPSRKQPPPPPTFGPRPPSSLGHTDASSIPGAVVRGVATGTIGAGYGPYAYNPNQAMETGVYSNTRFSISPSETSAVTPLQKRRADSLPPPPSASVPQYMQWDKDPEVDDFLHNPDPRRDKRSNCTPFSLRGWVNVSALVVLVFGLITLFIGYPVITHFTHRSQSITGFNLGGINASGQIPDLPGLPLLIDNDTPSSAYTRTGTDGKKYDLVFSDEFNVDGRSFYPGDDPFWEAADLHYWPTGDLEWYDPGAVTTKDGKLVITLTEMLNHGLNFQSGMLTSWNKLCFTTGYIEVSVSLPGTPLTPGLWPAAWTLGNLGRAGYGATTDGMWPYTYDSCDLGTFPNQTTKSGTPAAAVNGAPGGGPLSYLPGQRLSACTCPGSDHPGPKVTNGRGVPEVDIFEAQVDVSRFEGQVSQSFQCAPYNAQYEFVNSTPATTIYDSDITTFNSYKGGVYQEAVSALTYVDSQFYNNTGYATYAFEMWSDPNNREDGYITWFSDGKKTWTATANTVGPDSVTQISSRIIPEEPMYVIFNLGLSPGFQAQDFKHLQFPSQMHVDYIRIYQREGVTNGVTCDPPSRPTSSYIQKHMNAYTNPNLTTWEQAGNSFPKNSLYNGC